MKEHRTLAATLHQENNQYQSKQPPSPTPQKHKKYCMRLKTFNIKVILNLQKRIFKHIYDIDCVIGTILV